MAAVTPWGITRVGFPGSIGVITSFATQVGSTPSYVLWYNQFAGSSFAYSASDFNTVIGAGYTSLFTWEPRDNSSVLHISNADITGGTYDTFIDTYANGIKALSGMVYLRLAHEMNGNWYDWCPGNNGNTASSYIAMWRYVWGRFQSAGVTNVKWVWCPNVHWGSDVATYASLYPGDSYVDVIGLDGYNFAESSANGWQSYSTVFNSSMSDVLAVAPSKPYSICEIGCSESTANHSKAAWIEDTIYQIRHDSRISFMAWFSRNQLSINPPRILALDSSTDSLLAFTSALVQKTGFSSFGVHA